MRKTRLWLATMAVLLCSITASAHSFEVGGIYYNITSEEELTVAVTYRGISSTEYSDEYTGAVTIPETVTYNSKAYRVTTIENGAFKNCSKLTTITIPEGVTAIANFVFYGCVGLTSITIPESVTMIGSGAFRDCSSLTSITIPEGVTTIGENAFRDCTSLTSVKISNTVTVIEGMAFGGCSNLTSINIPEGVVSIGPSAFIDCSNLVSVTISKGTISISETAFYNCKNLASIIVCEDNTVYDSRNGCNAIIATKSNTLIRGCYTTIIPESVTTIGSGAFKGCTKLTSITIPESVTTIGSGAFKGCTKLTSITIPESVTTIGNNAFLNCENLSEVINYSDLSIQIGSTSHGHVAYYADNVFNGIIGYCYFYTADDGVHHLRYYAGSETALVLPKSYNGESYEVDSAVFAGNDRLTSVVISEGVKTIKDKAFKGCTGLTTLVVGSNVDSYGTAVFDSCMNVKELTVLGSVMPEIPSEVLTSITLRSPVPLETKEFANAVYRNCELHVPEGSIARYQAADVWKNFWYIYEFDPTGIEGTTADEAPDTPIYNMNGMRMTGTRSTLPAGMYIQDGKKFVVM